MSINLDDAIQAHSDWKLRLLKAATGGEEVLDAVKIGQDCNCLLGKWLHGDGEKQFGSLSSFRVCIKNHAEFHLQASKVATMINAGRSDEARKMLDRGTPYSEISLQVVLAIRGLQREAKL